MTDQRWMLWPIRALSAGDIESNTRFFRWLKERNRRNRNFSLDHPAWSCLHINHRETLAGYNSCCESMGPSLGKPSSYYLLISRVLVKLSPIRFLPSWAPSSVILLLRLHRGRLGCAAAANLALTDYLSSHGHSSLGWHQEILSIGLSSIQNPLKQLTKLIATPTRGFPSTWATPRCQFSLMTFCSTLLS